MTIDQTPATAPTVNPNAAPGTAGSADPTLTPPPAVATPTTPNTSPTDGSIGTPPQTNLQPGAQGVDVAQLQNYLVQMGYLTPDQVATGQGTYGPQTTAAVAQLQKSLGVNAGTASGSYGPKTQAALASKYQGIFQSVKNTTAPDQAGIANQQIQQQSQPSTDPVMTALTSSMEPIMQSLSQVLQNINNPALTAVSLQNEYNTLAQQNNLPGMQADLLNMTNIMNGTEDDIRNEIQKGGGEATDSQVLAMTAGRNKVIMKQYNALATQYQAAQTNVSNMMQYATTDQATQLQRAQASAGVTESMASIESQMVSMGVTMQQHATDNLNKIVTNVGYQGLASQAAGNPQMLSSYENLLGLAPGSLSNPQSLQQLETLRQQQVALGAQKVQIQMYNAGLGTGTNSTNTPGGYITSPTGTQSLVALNENGSDSQGRPYNMTSSQAQNLLGNGATVDPGTQNMVVNGVGYYVKQSDGSYRLSIDPTSTEGKYINYRNILETAPTQSTSPLNMRRESMVAQAAIKQYVASPIYQNVANGAVYLSRINAAMTNPGSVSDLELADSIIKINNGGGQVTEAQINTYFAGQSFADKLAVVGNKITSKGGVLSPQQRQDLQGLATETFSQYRNQYQQLYVSAMQNLEKQNVPAAYWGNMPDFTSFLTQAQ